jgi:hypothetical protein
VNDFINKIKSFKEQNVEIPEEVAMGHEVFSENDLNQLVSSFIVIVPAVTYFNVKVDKDADGNFKGYDAELKTSFSILNVDTMLLEKEIIIETTGYDKDRETAIQEAISDITGDLVFEIKSVPIFTLKTGVLEVYSGGLTLQMGEDMGIKKGFEFVVVEEQVLSSGHKRSKETALVIVNDVDEEVSEATILYGKPVEGAQLKEIPRVGVEGQLYGHSIIDTTLMDLSALTVGLRGTLALGVYKWRPFAGVEIPFSLSGDDQSQVVTTVMWLLGIPFTAYVGMEYTMYLGRLQISPAAALGLSGLYFYEPPSEDRPLAPTHIGGKAYLSLSYLVTRDMKIAVDAGYAFWGSILPDIINSYTINSYNGAILGASVILKI